MSSENGFLPMAKDFRLFEEEYFDGWFIFIEGSAESSSLSAIPSSSSLVVSSKDDDADEKVDMFDNLLDNILDRGKGDRPSLLRS